MQTLEKPLPPLTEFAIGSNTASGCVGGLALDLRELRAFVTVGKDGRFAAAAHRLTLTPTGDLSHHSLAREGMRHSASRAHSLWGGDDNSG